MHAKTDNINSPNVAWKSVYKLHRKCWGYQNTKNRKIWMSQAGKAAYKRYAWLMTGIKDMLSKKNGTFLGTRSINQDSKTSDI